MDCFKETQANIIHMLKSISCVKCSSLSKEMFIIFTCNHKYCENCLPKDTKKMGQEKCPSCNSEMKQQEVLPDAFTAKLLHTLLNIQSVINETVALKSNEIPPALAVDEVEFNEVEMLKDGGNTITENDEDHDVGIGNVRVNEKSVIIKNAKKSVNVAEMETEIPPLNLGSEIANNVKDHVENVATGSVNHFAMEIENGEENNFEDYFQDPFEGDDIIVASQIRPRSSEVKAKQIFPFESDDMIVETQIRPRSSEVKPKKIFPNDNEKSTVSLKESSRVTVDNKKPPIPIANFESESEVKQTQPLPRKKRLPSVRRLNTSLINGNISKKINTEDNKKEEHATFSISLPVETPKVSIVTVDDNLPDKGKDDQQNKDGKPIVQTQFRKSLTTVKPKKIFFTSKRKNTDDDSDSNPITDIGVKKVVEERSMEDDSFLEEILNPRKSERVPFKPLKTYTKSSKPKIKPRLNYSHASDSEEDFLSTPQQPANKKLEKPPELTPYTNKSYSPVRKRLKVKKMSIGESENMSKCKEKDPKNVGKDATTEKIFDYNDRSPSPPPLTPYPIQTANEKKESNVSLRSRKRQCTSVGIVDLTVNEKSVISVPSESVKTAPTKPALKSRATSSSGKTSLTLTTIKKGRILATPIKTVGRGRRKTISTGTCDSPGGSSISSSASSCLTPGGVNKRNAKGETLLHVAARKGDIKKVQELIASGVELDAVDYNGYTALHEAISSRSKLGNNFSIAKILCDAGCNVNVPAGDYKETPLHEASRLGFRTVVELLLSHKASPNVRNSHGSLPRDLTTNESVKKLIDTVVKSKEEVNLSSEEMDDPAVLKMQFETVVAFFACNTLQQIGKECQNVLKIKFANELGKDVTYIIFEALPQSHVPFCYEYLYGLMNGSWMVSDKWIKDSLEQGSFVSPRNYEILGCQPSTVPATECNFLSNDGAPKRARVNKELGNPGLFDGMNFLIYKSTAFHKLTKKQLGKLISTGNGEVINREPNPETLDPFEYPKRFHASEDNNKLHLTTHVILFDQTNQPANKFKMEHVKSLNIKWLIDSSLNFKLLDPEDYTN